MLTELRIGNFKAFGPPQRIPIKPLTLIFGANSSGKSSIIHGLLLARHILDGGEPDARTLTGLADTVELGGFRQFVHAQNPGEKVELQLTHAFSDTDDYPLLRGGNQGENISAKIQLEWSNSSNPAGGQIRSVFRLLDSNDDELWTWPEADWSLRGKVNLLSHVKHPEATKAKAFLELRKSKERSGNSDNPRGEWDEKLEKLLLQSGLEKFLESKLEEKEIYPLELTKPCSPASDRLGSGPLIPRLSRSEKAFEKRLQNFLEKKLYEMGEDEEGVEETLRIIEANYRIREFLSEAALVFSQPMDYLGPFRYRPPRFLSEPDLTDPTWQSGGGAVYWRLCQNAEAREQVNQALERLETGYRLQIDHWLSEQHPHQERPELLLEDKDGRLLSFNDVGTGISQMLPILAARGAPEGMLTLIEQPEIHLHPRLQAELGDVFIESALGERKNTLILETHSEHLILRILRRIRETTEDTLPKGLPPVRPEDVSVLYVQPGPEGSEAVDLPVAPDGSFTRPWPGGFFEEAFNELF